NQERSTMARLTFPFSRSVCRWLLQKIYQSIGHPRVRLSLARGEAFPPGGTEILTTVRIADLRTLATLVVTPESGLATAIAKGESRCRAISSGFLTLSSRRSEPRTRLAGTPSWSRDGSI